MKFSDSNSSRNGLLPVEDFSNLKRTLSLPQMEISSEEEESRCCRNGTTNIACANAASGINTKRLEKDMLLHDKMWGNREGRDFATDT